MLTRGESPSRTKLRTSRQNGRGTGVSGPGLVFWGGGTSGHAVGDEDDLVEHVQAGDAEVINNRRGGGASKPPTSVCRRRSLPEAMTHLTQSQPAGLTH